MRERKSFMNYDWCKPECVECHASFENWYKSEEEATTKWNRRKPEVYIGVDLASGQDFTFCAGKPERSEG